MPKLTEGFLSEPSIAPYRGGAIVAGQFAQQHYRECLFDILGIVRPQSLDRALDLRRAGFVAGRAMVRIAQEAMGVPPEPVGIADNRAPIWPDELSGSISHTHRHCICVLLPKSVGSPGVDIEIVATGSALVSLRKIALSRQDITHVRASDLPFETGATLCFSAKEALYKALNPTVGHLFGFDAAELTVPPNEKRLSLRLTRSLHPTLLHGTVFDVACKIGEDTVTTVLTLGQTMTNPQ